MLILSTGIGPRLLAAKSCIAWSTRNAIPAHKVASGNLISAPGCRSRVLAPHVDDVRTRSQLRPANEISVPDLNDRSGMAAVEYSTPRGLASMDLEWKPNSFIRNVSDRAGCSKSGIYECPWIKFERRSGVAKFVV